MKDRERKRETESLLGSLPDERFAQLVNLGKKLTDWSNEQSQHAGGDREADEEMDDGVPVMIGDDEDEDEDETDIREIDENEDEDEDNENQTETTTDQGVIKGKVTV